MLREKVLKSWGSCKGKVLEFKAKGIGSNYLVMNKRTILGLASNHSHSSLKTLDFSVNEGQVREIKRTGKSSNGVVEIHTELLKVAILEEIEEEEPFLRNYEGEVDHGPSQKPPPPQR